MLANVRSSAWSATWGSTRARNPFVCHAGIGCTPGGCRQTATTVLKILRQGTPYPDPRLVAPLSSASGNYLHTRLAEPQVNAA
jgi:hypothetical protein